MTQEEVSRTHREEFNGALKNNDLAKLSEIYADDYMLVRPDGSKLSKQQILDDLKEHSMIFRSISLTNEQVRVHGPVGILTGDSEAITVRDGKESATKVRLVAVYVRENDRLALVHFQSNLLQS
jgi:ketosteroid isomerase-like protein